MATLTFFGAAGTVTGSKHLLDLGDRRILVDCGLFQGLKDLRLRNWAAFPVDSQQPAIVIASSGMATGGRVLHHLAAVLPDTRCTVLFVGHQAAGTRGRQLCDGARQVKLHGQMVPVAARIERIDSMSAHADAAEMMRWLSGFSGAPAMTYLVHGEPTALEALGKRIVSERGWPIHIAKYLERVEVDLR